MLRKILVLLGFIVAILPYLGFPYSIAHWIWTGSGVAIILLLTISKKGKSYHDGVREESEERPMKEKPRSLHVERTEVEDYPRMHVERTTTRDTERVEETPNTETEIEKTVTVIRRKKSKNRQYLPREEGMTPGGV